MTVIIAMILAALLGLHRVLDEVESLKERIISMIHSYVEVREVLDQAKRKNRRTLEAGPPEGALGEVQGNDEATS
ncbi:hypothetical protein [Streptomyces sp. NPDC001876]|uniref:hypothetical protein n=1 Tax=Streptomyces sp. NPDC001876 TaxID=3154402 RepID=UPI00332EA0A1